MNTDTRQAPRPTADASAPADPVRNTDRALRVAWLLSAGIVLLMAVAAAGGLWVSGLYRDPAAISAAFRGWDLVTLTIAAPILAGALVGARRRRPAAQLIWAGTLAYGVYTYAFYLFGAAFNGFFLIHVALFTLSLSALLLVLANLGVAGIAGRFRPRTPARWISGFLMVMAASLGAIWSFEALRFAVTGDLPDSVGPAPWLHLGIALDLALVVPGYVVAAVLLWQRRPWGYVSAAALAVFSVLTQLTFMSALVFQANAHVPGAAAFDPLEMPIVAGFLIVTALLLGNLRPVRERAVTAEMKS